MAAAGRRRPAGRLRFLRLDQSAGQYHSRYYDEPLVGDHPASWVVRRGMYVLIEPAISHHQVHKAAKNDERRQEEQHQTLGCAAQRR